MFRGIIYCRKKMKKSLEPRDWAKKNHKDRIVKLEDEIKSLKAQIRAKDKTIRNLLSEVATLEAAWDKTKDYLSEVVEDRSLKELVETSAKERPLKKSKNRCPKCGGDDFKTLKFNGFRVDTCGNSKCGHRKKIDEHF